MGGGQALWQMAGGRWAPTCRRTTSSSSIPKYIGDGRGEREGEGGQLRRLASVHQEPLGLAAQPRAAGADAVEDGRRPSTTRPGCWSATRSSTRSTPPGNQLPYIDRIQMTRRREPGGAEPPGDRRPVRPPGAPHGDDQAPGVPREPGQGRLRRQARPGAERLRRHAPDQPRVRGGSRGREVAPHRRLPPGAVDGHRPGSAQRDVLARDRRHRAPSPRPTPRPTTPGRSGGRSGRRSTSTQANALLDKIGLSKKDGEGYRLRLDGKGRLRIELQTSAGAFIPHTQIAEMIKEQWKKIGIQADVKEVERSLFFTRVAGERAPDRASGPTTAPSCCTSSRVTGFPSIPGESLMGTPIAVWYASGGKQGKAPDDTPLMKAMDMFRSANGKKQPERVKIAQEIFKIMIDGQYSHRHRRPVAGHDGRAHRQPQDGEHAVAADQRPALPDAGHVSTLDVLLQGVGAPGRYARLAVPGGQHGRPGGGSGPVPG